jgi:hypothetical protein
MMELADDLLERTARLDPNDDRVLEDLLRIIIILRNRHVSENIDYLRFLFEEAQNAGEVWARQYGQSMQQHVLAKQRLDRALGRLTSHL